MKRIKSDISYKTWNVSKSPRLKGKALFKFSVLKVIENLAWMQDDLLTPEMREKKVVEEGHLINFDEKLMLACKLRMRSPEKLMELAKKFAKTKIFKGFTLEAILKIMKVIKFEYFSANRTLVKEGRNAQAMYIVVGGLALSTVVRSSPFTGEVKIQTIYYKAGSKIGDLDLFFHESRSQTVITCDPGVYVLRLSVTAFNELYAPNRMEKKWNELMISLRLFGNYFHNYPKEAFKELYRKVKLKHLPSGVLLPKKSPRGRSIAIFIIEGLLQVIQRILVLEITNNDLHKTRSYKLYHAQEEINDLPRNVIPIFMKTVNLKPGACLGIGEQLFQYHIITETDVTIMTIPIYVLKKYNHINGYIWKRIAFFVDYACPDINAIFDAFVDSRKWIHYKKMISKPYAAKSTHLTLSLHDLPIPMRAERLRLKPKIVERIMRDPDYMIGE